MRLLREWVRIILEGYKEDQETLVKKFPDSNNIIMRMNPKMISWFIRRFGNNPNVKETHPFEDCISTIQKYDKKAAGLGQKYGTNEYFRSLVDKRFPEKTWSNLADYVNMTVDQMEEIMGLSERKKPRFDVEGNEPDRSDYLGKFGPWNLWMPTTRENSVKIAGYDPETLIPKTTWCTARVTGSNLFYNYAGQGVILYYIIKDNPQRDTDWLSVGFINGVPVLRDMDGGVSVDRANEGLTEEKLKSIWGGYYDRLMTVMEEKIDEIGYEHPAKKKIEEAARSLPAYQNLIKGLSREEIKELNLIIIYSDRISREVASVILNNINVDDLRILAEETNSDIILILLSEHSDIKIVQRVAENSKTPEEILEKLSTHMHESVVIAVALNHNTSVYVLTELSTHKNFKVRKAVAKNSNTPVHILKNFADDKNSSVRSNLVGNPNTPIYILEKLCQDKDVDVRQILAANTKSEEILEILSKDEDTIVRRNVAYNKHTSDDILDILSKDTNESVRRIAIQTLQILYFRKN